VFFLCNKGKYCAVITQEKWIVSQGILPSHPLTRCLGWGEVSPTLVIFGLIPSAREGVFQRSNSGSPISERMKNNQVWLPAL
jgi:hypothetical protein